MKPRVVAIGGFDPSGRAGVLADVATIRSLGAEPLAVVTTLTAQGKRPRAAAVAPKLLAAQLTAVADSGPIHAVKVGVIPDRAALKLLVKWLRALDAPCVVDPVTISSKGLRLSILEPKDYARFSGLDVVLTPNQHELAPLQRLRGFRAVVVKSLGPGRDAIFVDGKPPVWLEGKLLPRTSGHRGTGCRFASALAVDLAYGHTVVHAVKAAKRAVRKFLATPILNAV